MRKLSPNLIGLLQALGVIVYVALISGLFELLGRTFVIRSVFLGSLLMLALLVFSAAVTGSIVFGYSAYLGLNKRVKEALSVVGFTLLYLIGMIIIIVILIVTLVSG